VRFAAFGRLAERRMICFKEAAWGIIIDNNKMALTGLKI
jgi:hypothetical protein